VQTNAKKEGARAEGKVPEVKIQGHRASESVSKGGKKTDGTSKNTLKGLGNRLCKEKRKGGGESRPLSRNESQTQSLFSEYT